MSCLYDLRENKVFVCHITMYTPELGMSRFWQDLRHLILTMCKSLFWQGIRYSSITMCTRTQYSWKVKVLAKPQAFNYTWQVNVLARHCAFISYNVYQEALHLASVRFRQDIRHSPITMCTRRHYTWQDLRHSSLIMCTRLHYAWQAKALARTWAYISYHVYQIAFHTASQGFGKTSDLHLLQCVPEWIALGKSRFWQNLWHSSFTMCTRMHYTWQAKVLARHQEYIY